MKLTLSKDPLRLILGGILLVFGVLSLLGIHVIPGQLFTLTAAVTGALPVFRTKYL